MFLSEFHHFLMFLGTSLSTSSLVRIVGRFEWSEREVGVRFTASEGRGGKVESIDGIMTFIRDLAWKVTTVACEHLRFLRLQVA